MNRAGSLQEAPSFGDLAANPRSAAASAVARVALQAVDICKQFGGLIALDRVSLSLRPGEVHGLIGPNGSGKTTLLNLLSGYYQPTSGSIRHDGEELAAATVQRRARIGVARTFQKPRLLPTLSVLDNAVLGAWPHARAGFLATAFGLPWVAREDKALREHAAELLHGIGLGARPAHENVGARANGLAGGGDGKPSLRWCEILV